MFTVEEIKSGYLCELGDGTLTIAVPVANKDLILMDSQGFSKTSLYERTDFKATSGDSDYDIIKVWGLPLPKYKLFSTTDRPLLWSKNVRKVTLSEIEEKFGCQVEIIKEDN